MPLGQASSVVHEVLGRSDALGGFSRVGTSLF
jgi:hypothetical protein